MIAIQERHRISGAAPVFSQDLAGDDRILDGGFPCSRLCGVVHWFIRTDTLSMIRRGGKITY